MKTKKDVELMFEAASNAEPVKASMLIEFPVEFPEGGVEGQFLKKTANGSAWGDIPAELPELPTVDGEYKLVIVGGVASWVLIA